MRIHSRFITVVFLTVLSFVSLKSISYTQAQPQPAQHQRHEDDEDGLPASSANVAPDTSVITIEGVCDDLNGDRAMAGKKSDSASQAQAASRGNSSECKTIVTKAQYEKLMYALNPKMPGMVQRQLATSYPRLLLFAQKARELGLDQNAVFVERMRFATIQLLAQSLNGYFEQEANQISDAEIQQYYEQNAIKFEKAELLRIFVPKQRQEGSTASSADDRTLEVAQKLQARAAAGEDFQTLQKEAFEAAHISSGAPNVSMGKIIANRLPVSHQEVFEMKPDQVSKVMTDSSGYYIYKVVSKEMIPLSQAGKDIRKAIATQRVQRSVDALTKSFKFELNPSYFGAAAADTASVPKANSSDRGSN